jgi:hypothetical protein
MASRRAAKSRPFPSPRDSYSRAATNGEVEPEYFDASLSCAVGVAVDDTGSARDGDVGSEARIRFVSATYRLSNNDTALSTFGWISQPIIENARERD